MVTEETIPHSLKVVKSLHIVKVEGIIEPLLLEVSKVCTLLIQIGLKVTIVEVQVRANCSKSDRICRYDGKRLLIIVDNESA
jgi:hypothetical protein